MPNPREFKSYNDGLIIIFKPMGIKYYAEIHYYSGGLSYKGFKVSYCKYEKEHITVIYYKNNDWFDLSILTNVRTAIICGAY